MADFKVYKMNALPASPAANAVYFVSNGSGVDMYVTDSSGSAKPIKVVFGSQAQGKFLGAPPVSGGGEPVFRFLISSDLPDLPIAKLTQGSPSTHIETALMGSGGADSTKFLRGDNSWQTIQSETTSAGTYTPVASNLTNVQSYTGRLSYYHKIGNYVFVNGGFYLTSAAQGLVALDFSIPLASGNTGSIIGFATKTALSGGRISERIETNVGNDKAYMETSMEAGFSIEFRFTFSYQI